MISLLLACANPDGDTGSQPVGFAAVQPIFEETCAATCHSSSAWQLDLRQPYAATVDVASVQAPLFDLVDPGDPDRSYLVAKLRGEQTTLGGMGNTMPSAGNLAEAERALIEQWVRDGAQP